MLQSLLVWTTATPCSPAAVCPFASGCREFRNVLLGWSVLRQYKAMSFTTTLLLLRLPVDRLVTYKLCVLMFNVMALLQSTWMKCATVVATTVCDPRHSWTSQQHGQELALLTAHSQLQDQLRETRSLLTWKTLFAFLVLLKTQDLPIYQRIQLLDVFINVILYYVCNSIRRWHYLVFIIVRRRWALVKRRDSKWWCWWSAVAIIAIMVQSSTFALACICCCRGKREKGCVVEGV